MRRCFAVADERHVRSLAIPPVGTGALRFPPKLVARIMCEELDEFVNSNPGTTLRDIRFVMTADKPDVIAVSCHDV
jgi:O-acetyl-ADP-ribose deacetylase (regulator of RNase III)